MHDACAQLVGSVVLYIHFNFKPNDFYSYLIEGVRVKAYLKALPQRLDNGYTFMQVDDDIKMDFSVKDIRMGVENLANGNTVLRKGFFFLNCI